MQQKTSQDKIVAITETKQEQKLTNPHNRYKNAQNLKTEREKCSKQRKRTIMLINY